MIIGTLASPSLGEITTEQLLVLAAVICAGALTIFACYLIRKDFHDFLSLGPGGTPHSFDGYLRVKFFGLFAHQDRYIAGPIPEDRQRQCGYLSHIPTRRRPRPVTKGIAPHRQMEQRPDQVMHEKLAAEIERMAPGTNCDLAVGTSCFEKHGTGLFSLAPREQTCKGEIVHLHASDGSMHIVLDPADAKTVLDAGWGERHPLAGVFDSRFLPSLPAGFILLYAPLTEDEVKTVLHVISAGAWFMNGGRHEA